MSKIIIYTKPGCPYCEKARAHYRAQGLPFEDRNAQDNPVFRQEMLVYADGDPTVPVIIIDGAYQQSGWQGRG